MGEFLFEPVLCEGTFFCFNKLLKLLFRLLHVDLLSKLNTADVWRMNWFFLPETLRHWFFWNMKLTVFMWSKHILRHWHWRTCFIEVFLIDFFNALFDIVVVFLRFFSRRSFSSLVDWFSNWVPWFWHRFGWDILFYRGSRISSWRPYRFSYWLSNSWFLRFPYVWYRLFNDWFFDHRVSCHRLLDNWLFNLRFLFKLVVEIFFF